MYLYLVWIPIQSTPMTLEPDEPATATQSTMKALDCTEPIPDQLMAWKNISVTRL